MNKPSLWNECFPKLEISIFICETEASDMNFEHWTMWHITPTFEFAWHKTIVKLSLCLSLSISQSLNLSLSMRDRDRADIIITFHHHHKLFKDLIVDLYSSVIHHWNCLLKPILFLHWKNKVNWDHYSTPCHQ